MRPPGMARSAWASSNQALLVVPHPESAFLDDGQYHSAWQDWQLGLTHHAALGTLDIASHAVLTYPSHDYVFFASAPVGQRLKKFRIGVNRVDPTRTSELWYQYDRLLQSRF